ncbi:MAG TPA: kynureninase [Planctomycetaceae bacterium]|nr:kynureninase [Planctomycetaceae bacterium]
MPDYQFDLEEARRLDSADPLGPLRSDFLLPETSGKSDVYFVGNSLGLQPRKTSEELQRVLDQWQHSAVHGHFEGDPAWLDLPEMVSSRMAPLVGAKPEEVVVMNTLTVNLHLMMATFYQPTETRFRVLMEEHAFPSDHQAVVSHLALRGQPAEAIVSVAPEPGSSLLSTEHILQTIEEHRESLALILLPGVQYYTGQLLEVSLITQKAQEYGIPIGFDLAHAVGNVPLQLNDWGVDFACWCTYKYLNSGPGSLGGCFIHSRHATRRDLPRLAGWWGHERQTRFEMEPDFVPSADAQGWQLSNPPILAMVPICTSLGIFEEAGGMQPLRAKSLRLTDYFRASLEHKLQDRVSVLTPADPEQYGCQLSLEIVTEQPGKTICNRLSRSSVHTDWREPHVIRAAPVPLYNSFQDVHRFVKTLADCLGQ